MYTFTQLVVVQSYKLKERQLFTELCIEIPVINTFMLKYAIETDVKNS